jgi:sporulation protein YlmC with PRC-barrel domain
VSWVSFSQLVGHPLVDITEGRKIGEVRDVLLDEQRRFIQAFATRGGLFHGPTYVPALKATIGVDAVTFQPGALEGQDTSWLDRLPRASETIGMRVLTDTGKLIGTVDNLRLDPNNSTVLALEVKPEHTGLLHRLGSGRRLMPATGVISYGPDTIVAQETALIDA